MHGRGIRAARDRTGDTAAFPTNGHCFLLPQHLRAAKWHFYPDTIRPRTARNLRTRTPQGDGNFDVPISILAFAVVKFKNQNPARGRKPKLARIPLLVVVEFKNQNPARGRKHNPVLTFALRKTENLRTRTPQGDGNPNTSGIVPDASYPKFKNQNPARGRKRDI